MATRVLCLHGIQDNCGTFDRLIPLLQQGFYFVCLDLPGHGHSSHFHVGYRLSLESYVLALKRVVDYLEWTKFKCVGHSFGGMIASLFTSIYPEYVESLVMIDAAGPEAIHPQDTVNFIRHVCDGLLTIENKLAEKSPPLYTYEQAVNLILTKRPSQLTRQSAEILIQRSLKENADGLYSLNIDQRLKVHYNQIFSPMQQMAIIQSIKCPVLYLHAIENPFQKKHGNKIVRKMYKSNPNVRVVKVNGNHDVHLNHPERIADLINKFIVYEHSNI